MNMHTLFGSVSPLDLMHRQGGRIEWRELRACDYGAPTIRKRLFLIVRFDGQAIVWPEPTHGDPNSEDVIAGRKLPWRTAAEIIDWSLPCPSIFDTAPEIWAKHGLRSVRPLAENTMARVARGMKRYVLDSERPFLVRTDMTSAFKRNGVNDVDAPLNTIMTAGSFGVVAPSITRFNSGATGSAMDEPLSTITANSFVKRPGGAAPVGMIAPHLMTMRNSGKPFNGADEPTHTITAGGAGLSVVVPSLVGCGGRAGQSRPRGGDEPMATITTKADGCVAAAFIAQQNNDSRRIGGVNPGRGADEPLSTVTASGAQQGVATVFLAQNNYLEPGHDAREPLSTIVGRGSTQAPVAAFISRQFGTSTGHGADAPLGTVTADGGGKSALIAPYLQKYYGTGDGARLDEPCHTVTVNDRFGHVEAAIDAPPFTSDQEDRAREVAAFLRSHGFWDEREFVTLEIAGMTFVIVDIGMRMLTPRELFNAQGFPPDYIIDGVWEGEGEERHFVEFPKNVQVSCCGNSVSPPPYAAIVAANCPELMVMREAAE